MAAFSGKGLAPLLIASSPDRAIACRSVTSLFLNHGDPKKAFAAAGHVLGPLLAIARVEPAAAAPLATMVRPLVRAAAYPEAAACIDAVITLESAEPIGKLDEPWHYRSTEPMTWPRQRAFLWLWRGECRLAAGDGVGAEEALRESARRAIESGVPTPLGLTGARSPYQGSWDDAMRLARVRGAEALRRRYDGLDPCTHRKVKKGKGGGARDAALLALARASLDEVLTAVRPRAVGLYAPLTPKTKGEHPDLTQAERDARWIGYAYLVSALVFALAGDTARAKVDLGRAKWISALFDPAHRHEDTLREAVARLGATQTAPD